MQRLRYGATRDIIETVILTLIVFLVAREVVQNFQVEGSSMDPSLGNKDLVLVNKFAYRDVDLGPFGDVDFGAPSRGDVIVFRSPTDADRDFVKRVIGLPGDRIEVRDGLVLVNGLALDETAYISAPPTYLYPNAGLPSVVPPRHYFVLGDNRNASLDSHSFGPIHERLLVGEVIFRWFPLGDIGGGGGRELVPLPAGASP